MVKIALSTPLSELTEGQMVAVLGTAYPEGSHPSEVAGDDCAVIAPQDGRRLVTSTDLLVEGEDFLLPQFSLYDVGWKTAAVNLSDIGAMGAEPTGLLITLGLPRTLTARDLLDFATGVHDAVARIAPEVSVWGGDLSHAPIVLSGATSFGQAVAPVARGGARVGDGVFYSGDLGWAAAGVEAVRRGGSPDERWERASSAQRRPIPGVAAARRIASDATAMMDVSDGLSIDGARMAHASGVAIDFDSPVLAARCTELGWARHELGLDPWQLVMAGGEDFGCLATLPAGTPAPEGFERVGTVVEFVDHRVLLSGKPTPYLGFDHFAGSRGPEE